MSDKKLDKITELDSSLNMLLVIVENKSSSSVVKQAVENSKEVAKSNQEKTNKLRKKCKEWESKYKVLEEDLLKKDAYIERIRLELREEMRAEKKARTNSEKISEGLVDCSGGLCGFCASACELIAGCCKRMTNFRVKAGGNVSFEVGLEPQSTEKVQCQRDQEHQGEQTEETIAQTVHRPINPPPYSRS
jgi:hypothetical protein